MDVLHRFAYVDVPDAKGVKAGIALSEGHLDGRRLLIKSGGDYTGRPALDATAVALATVLAPTAPITASDPEDAITPKQGKTGLTKTAQKILRAQKNPPAPTLFVGNLSFQTTSDGLREIIENAARARDASQWNARKPEERERKTKKREDRDADLRGTPEPVTPAAAISAPTDMDEDSDSDDVEEDKPEVEAADAAPKAKSASVQKDKPVRAEGEVRGAGIRKIRMGEFEDSGKCKG